MTSGAALNLRGLKVGVWGQEWKIFFLNDEMILGVSSPGHILVFHEPVLGSTLSPESSFLAHLYHTVPCCSSESCPGQSAYEKKSIIHTLITYVSAQAIL